VSSFTGLTENAGHENDGPSKLQGMKLQDVKMADQCAGHENAGPKLTAGRKVAEAEIQVKRSYHYHEVCKYLNPKHCITLSCPAFSCPAHWSVIFTSSSTHNRSFRRRVFPGNHWYWQNKL